MKLSEEITNNIELIKTKRSLESYIKALEDGNEMIKAIAVFSASSDKTPSNFENTLIKVHGVYLKLLKFVLEKYP